MSTLKFIVTRFTQGSAGKFLSTVLQTSVKVDHWSAIVQKYKEFDEFQELYESIVSQYVSRGFPKDYSTYMSNEPIEPYCVDLYSTSYPRGNDITLEAYLDHAYKISDFRLIRCIDKDLMPNLAIHKPTLPLFCNNASVVTILTTSDFEKTWLHKTLWAKHFVERDGKIFHNTNNPDTCPFERLAVVLKWAPQYEYDQSAKQQLYNDHVLNNQTSPWYSDPVNFTQFDLEHNLSNIFINLSDFFATELFVNRIEQIFDYHNLGSVNVPLISNMHKIWWSRQIHI